MNKYHTSPKLPKAQLVAESQWHKTIDAERPSESHAYKDVYYRISNGKYFCVKYTNKVRIHTKFLGLCSTGDGDILDEKYSPSICFMTHEEFLKSAINEGAISPKDISDFL